MISKIKAAAGLGLLGLLATAAAAQTGAKLWQLRDDSGLASRPFARTATPDKYRTFALNKPALRQRLERAPEEFKRALPDNEIDLPMPDGTVNRFRYEHSLVVEQGLVDKYPELGNTYRGYGIDDPTATVRFDMLPGGFHAMILSPRGTVMIDPYANGDTDNYVAYYKRDLPRPQDGFQCEVGQKTLDDYLTSGSYGESSAVPDAPNIVSGTQLRTYRLALAATNEYAVAVGGNTIAGTLAAEVAIMNRVNGVYERDVAIHMNIIANNNLIVYAGDQMCGTSACNSTNDPYTNSVGTTMLGENTTNLNAIIGSSNFDIGHVFSTGGGGVATLSGPCGANKARGVTGLANPIGDAFAIDYVAHEMGHQWGANHTFNGSVNNCSGNRAGTAAYETGSGITIMGYAGICGNQDVGLHSIDTFHVRSLEEITAYSQSGIGSTCAVTTNTGNTPPTVSVVGGPTFNIPKQTPFILTAAGDDSNGDTVTYDWQEYDLGAPTTSVPNTDSGGAMPIFRPYAPIQSPSRTYPSLTYILNNANVPPSTFDCGRGAGTPCLSGELLPQIGRTMQFKVILRDNRPNGGGINTATATVVVDGSSGPFSISAPNSPVTFNGNSQQTVTWSVANTNNAPVSAANVNILLSTDGGNTFSTVLAANTPNDGSEAVTIPNTSTSTARIKVESSSGIFFDISDTNFTIIPSVVPAKHTASDFDGDGKSDVSIWRDSDGVWYSLNSSNGLFSATQFGTSGDRIVPGDYDGDGKTDFAVFRPSTGTWYLQQTSAGFAGIQFGISTDLPAQGDYDGDGKMDIAVFRPSNGTWYIERSSLGFTATQFGTLGDRPVAGDFDGDGKTDIAVFRPSTGVWYQLGSTSGFMAVQFGMAYDKVVPGDYDGDGRTDPAVYRDSEGKWYILRSSAGFTAIQFGISGDVPSPGDFDGDGKADTNVFRPSQGVWYRLNSSNDALAAASFGIATDRPTLSYYLPVQ